MIKQKLILILLWCVITNLCLGQEIEKDKCFTEVLHFKTIEQSNNYLKAFDNLNLLWKNYNHSNIPSRSMNTNNEIVLSIAIHDISASGNHLPASTIFDYEYIIEGLNLKFSDETGNSNPTNIQFCLAQQKVNGNTYQLNELQLNSNIANGLDQFSISEINNLVDVTNAEIDFNQNAYINIYIVDDIQGDTVGFSTLPPSHGNAIDGIYIERDVLINDTEFNENLNILVHEMGHYLGLFHTFGLCDPELSDTSCFCDNDDPFFNGDMVEDTLPSLPPIDGSDCPQNTICDAYIDSASTSDISNIAENYMNYNNLSCRDVFTPGQIERMSFMLNPDFGPRKSLLNNESCEDCSIFEGCEFEIVSNLERYPQVNSELIFTAQQSDCVVSDLEIEYTWVLTNLSTNTIIAEFNEETVHFTPSNAGNYALTLVASNENCHEDAINTNLVFQIIPEFIEGNCNFTIDNWTNWNRVSYTNGWALREDHQGFWDNTNINQGDFAHANTSRVEIQANTSSENFDIINANDFNDPNFSTPPAELNNSNILRVGNFIDGQTILEDGAANYVSYTFYPTAENARFRIHYTGMAGNQTNFNFIEPGAYFTDSNFPSTFGWFCQYKYDSPLDQETGTTIIGASENNANNLNKHPFNDFMFGNNNNNYYTNNSNIIPYNSQVIAGLDYKVMQEWRYIDLDFSEFIDDPNFSTDDELNTAITITFFARTNNNPIAKAHAYAYFGVECLGGGLPSHPQMDFEDLVMPCQNQSNIGCIFTQSFYFYYMNLEAYNYHTVTVEESDDNINFTPSSADLILLYTPRAQNGRGQIRPCLGPDDPPFRYYKVTLNTLRQEISDTFLAVRNFAQDNSIICDTNTQDYVGGDVNENLNDIINFVCLSPDDATFQMTLNLTEPCFDAGEGGYEYSWISNGSPIPGEHGSTLTIDANDIREFACNTYFLRRVKYTDPSCSSLTYYESEKFYFYSLNPYQANINNGQGIEDICLGNPFNLSFDANIQGCDSSTLTSYIEAHNLNTLPGSVQYTLLIDGVPRDVVEITYPNGINFEPQQVNFEPISDLSLGEHILSYEVNTNFNGCVNSNVRLLDGYDTTINVAPISIGGQIQVLNDCGIAVQSIDNGLTNGGYIWEYSYDENFNSTVFTINGQNANNIADLDMSLFNTFPVYLRRFSQAFPTTDDCPDDGSFSNIIEINTHQLLVPTFNPVGPICVNEPLLPLPTVSNNGIAGNWSPTLNNQETTTYTFVPDANDCAVSTTMTIEVRTSQNPGTDTSLSFCSNDNTTYNMASYIGAHDPGGIWSHGINGPGLFTPSIDGEAAEIIVTYTLPGNDYCNRATSTITITLDDCSDPCDASLLLTSGTLNGATLSWDDVTDQNYIVEFMANNDCPTNEIGLITNQVYIQNENSIDLMNVVSDLGRKCFSWRIKIEGCDEWSQWCQMYPAGSQEGVLQFVFSNDCTSADPCEWNESIALTSPFYDIVSGSDIEHSHYSSIIATNSIQQNASALYIANTSIELLPGFEAQEACVFEAFIDPCNVDLVLPRVHTSNKTISAASLIVYPNPTSETVTLKLRGDYHIKHSELNIYSINGRLVKTLMVPNSGLVNLSEFENGIYFFKIITTTGEVFIKKVIKQ